MRTSIVKSLISTLLSCSVFSAVSAIGFAGSASAQDLSNYRLNQVTLAGSHNTYDKKTDFQYFSDALSFVQLVELDVWAGVGKWYVSHSNPIANDNNCPKNGNAGATRNQDLRSCIDGLRKWHDAHPNHDLVVVKFEFKAGLGNAPSSLDDLIADIQGNGAAARIPKEWIFKPSDLMCKGWPGNCTSRYATPEVAIQAGNWPTIANLRGKFLFLLVPGTVATGAPSTYADALRNGSAQIAFPTVFATTSNDPRVDYYGNGSSNAAWTVIFDIQAGRLDDGTVSQSRNAWMAQNNFLILVSDSQPGGSPVDVAKGRTRLNQVSRDYRANIISTDQEKTGIPYSFPRP